MTSVTLSYRVIYLYKLFKKMSQNVTGEFVFYSIVWKVT